MLDDSLIKVLWYVAPIVMAARVNMPAGISYPIQDIVFDGVTTGTYTDCVADMFFTLGSAAGKDDYGRGRLRAAPTVNTLKVGRSSQGVEDGQLTVVDNAYISVFEDFRVHSKIPYIKNFVEYKDTDIPVGDLTEEPVPVANCGPDYARSIDPDTETITVFLDGRSSYAVADGATLTTFAWDLKGGTPLFGATTADDHLYVEYDPGTYFPALTVTDSNGKTHTARCFILADDPDDSLCVEGMQVQNITRNRQGGTMRLRTLIDLPRASFPDGAKVIAWKDIDASPETRQHILFTGWHQTDDASVRSLETHLQRETTFVCVDVAGRLDSLPGFHQRLELPDDDEITWGHMPAPNMDKFIHYLSHWHSTAPGVADLFLSGTGEDYRFVIFDSAGATLFEQLNRQANRIAHYFGANELGQLVVTVDQMLLNAADRTEEIQGSFIEQWWSELEFNYQRPPRVHTLHGSAVLTQEDYIIDDNGKKTILTAFAIAPGTTPGQGGQESTVGEELARDAQELYDRTGHRLARANARYGPLTISPTLGFATAISPARGVWVELQTSAQTAPQRGLDFTTIRALPLEVSNDYSYSETGTQVRVRIRVERETVGLPALAEVRTPAVPVGEQPTLPTTPPDFGLRDGQELVAGIGLDGYVYRTEDFQTDSGSGGPTWDRVDTGISEVLYSFVVDPFSPAYIEGAGAVNGWIATETDIYRVDDLFDTVDVTSVLTFAESADAASFHWRSIQASFGRFFAEEAENPWLLCVSYYGDTVGHEGTWATFSQDAGATWSTEVQITAYADSAIPTRFAPIGVYTSPKTPGLAYAAAYSAPADDPAHPLPMWHTWAGASGNTLQDTVLGASVSYNDFISATNGAGPLSKTTRITLSPPKDAVRVEVTVSWEGIHTKTGGLSSNTSDIDDRGGVTGVTRTGSENYTAPPNNGTTSGTFSETFTLTSGTDWPRNRELAEATPPTTPGIVVGWNMQAVADSSAGQTNTAEVRMTVVVTEIELDGGIIYTPSPTAAAIYRSTDWGAVWAEVTSGAGYMTPGDALAGSIHLPWEGNDDEELAYHGSASFLTTRQFRLLQSVAGVVTDISPTDGGVSFGPNKYGFSVRCFDSNRQFLLLAGIGNSTSSDPDEDEHAVFYSSDYGSSWDEIVAPIADSAGMSGRPAFEAAFSGDDPATLWVWGPPEYISYSVDSGATLDDRAGNLSSFSPGAWIGIAGGPI